MASNNLSSDLIVTFAHDLRQPLRTIMMQAQRIQRQGGEGVSGETNTRLDQIVAAARAQEELIASVVEYDQAGQQSGGFESARLLPIKVVIQTACMKVENYRRQCDGVIRFEHAPGHPGSGVYLESGGKGPAQCHEVQAKRVPARGPHRSPGRRRSIGTVTDPNRRRGARHRASVS